MRKHKIVIIVSAVIVALALCSYMCVGICNSKNHEQEIVNESLQKNSITIHNDLDDLTTVEAIAIIAKPFQEIKAACHPALGIIELFDTYKLDSSLQYQKQKRYDFLIEKKDNDLITILLFLSHDNPNYYDGYYFTYKPDSEYRSANDISSIALYYSEGNVMAILRYDEGADVTLQGHLTFIT